MPIAIILLIAYFISIVFIGILNRKNESKEDYFLAGNKLPSWLLAITFIASWWGGGSAVDVVDYGYKNGINSFWIYGMPVLLSTFFMYLLAGKIRGIATISQPEIMQKRYNEKLAFLLSILIILFMTLTAASQVVIIGKFFEAYLNINYTLAAFIGTLLVIVYSFFGGFKGVVLTDLFQFVFFLSTAIIVFIITYQNSGGFEHVISKATANGKADYNNFFYDIGNNLSYVITFGAAWMIQANVWQRISAAKSASQAKKMMGISFFVFIPLYLLVSLTGMLSYGFIDEIPATGIVPHIIKNYSSPVLGAFLFVGLCSAIMSTLDSLLNTGALSLTIDIYAKKINPSANTKQLVTIGRWSTLVLGIIAVLIALKIPSLLALSWIASDLISTTVFAPLVLGFIWKKANTKGAIASIIYGAAFSFYNLLIYLGVKLPSFWQHQSTTQAIIGILGSTLIFIVFSIFTDNKKLSKH